MNKLHDFRKNVMATFSKYTRRKKYYRVFVYRKLYIASCKSLPGISVLQSSCMFDHEVFWNVIGIQYAYDGHTFLRKFRKALVKVSLQGRTRLEKVGGSPKKLVSQEREKEEHIGCAIGTRLVLAHPRRPGL